MAENYIVINGKKAELTPEQLKALGLEREIKSLFERVNGTESVLYYHITEDGRAYPRQDGGYPTDEHLHKVANYCTDKEMMQQQAYRETLNRLLWRYSMEHKGNEIDWSNTENKYRITYNFEDNKWVLSANSYLSTFGAIYFATIEIAENAIKEIVKPFMAEHPDFKL